MADVSPLQRSESPAKADTTPNRSVQGERRVVTILFCDVEDSTAIAEQLDPEEWAEIMNEAFDYLIAPIYRYDGTVAKLMGDGFLAFFGAPLAHEDDPLRAILAGLDILAGIQPFRAEIAGEYRLDFNVRIGINTGTVVVGEIGTDQAGEYTAMGDAVNLAARMEQTAAPGTVQVAENTYRLAAPLFEWESLGPVEVRGKSEPVAAYRAIARKTQPGRLRGVAGLSSPLVGRESEMETLRRVCHEVMQGRGQIVCLLGDAGLGKSRLLEELRAALPASAIVGGADRDATLESSRPAPHSILWLESQGLSYEINRPYGLFRQLLAKLCGIGDNDSPAVAAAKIASGDAGGLPGVALEERERMTRCMQLLWSAGHDAAAPPGETVRREILETTYQSFANMAAQAPLALVYDDLHWADPASVDLIRSLMRLAKTAPVLMICAMRPYREAPAWQIKVAAETRFAERAVELVLRPLSGGESDALVDSLLAIADLPSSMRQLILRKTEGNPFFVEEVVRMWIDNGVVIRAADGVHWRATTGSQEITIPDNLQALLMARIDRLDAETRRTLQLAAVIGRTFAYRLLQGVTATPALPRHLQLLQEADLVHGAAQTPELEYTFRHELLRDAAYQTILHRQRRRYHRQVGETIETVWPDRLDQEAHRLAEHFFEAREFAKALTYALTAGDNAARLFAGIEAIAHYQRAREIVQQGLAETPRMANLYTGLGRMLEICGRHDEALVVYQELESVAQARQDARLELAALLPQATIYSIVAPLLDAPRSRALLERTLALARNLADTAAEVKTLWNLMLLEFFGLHNLQRAVAYGEEALALARHHRLGEELAYTLHDLARVYGGLGRVTEAFAAQEEAQQLWRALDNRAMLVDNLNMAAYAHLMVGRLRQAVALSEEGLALSLSIDNPWGQAYSYNVLGPLYLEIGELGKSFDAMQQAIVMWDQAGFSTDKSVALALCTWVYRRLGDSERALQQAREWESLVGDDEPLSSLALVTLASVHAHDGDIQEALALLAQAQDINDPAFSVTGDDTTWLALAVADTLLISGEYRRVLALVEQFYPALQAAGIQLFLPDLLRLKGVALIELGQVSSGQSALLAALAQAEEMGARVSELDILCALVQVEEQLGDRAQAARLGERARALALDLAGRANSPDLRAKFLGQPHIAAVMNENN